MNLFPIMGVNYEYKEKISKYRQDSLMFICIAVPWSLLATHERQAQINHGQTLKRLAERGGLSAAEAVAIIEDKRFDGLKITDADAHRKLLGYVQDHLI